LIATIDFVTLNSFACFVMKVVVEECLSSVNYYVGLFHIHRLPKIITLLVEKYEVLIAINDIVGFAQKRLSDVQPRGYVTTEGARESLSLRIIHSFIVE
jgi:hypothetical protein